MVSIWLWAYLLLAALAITQGLLVIAQIWEHRRFARSRFRWLQEHGCPGRVLLLIPCRGADVELENNLAALLQQDYDDYQVRFIVESEADPAYAAIQRVIASQPQVSCEIILAGQAPTGGQKVHNLRVATASIPPSIQYLAFVDSDARLGTRWLRAILARLKQPGVAVATGYRWFVPTRDSLANWILYSINANYALLFGAKSPSFVWGGSWAIRRDLFEALEIRREWKGTLSDDLVVTRVVRDSGLLAVFEPACMVRSPLDMTLREMLSFLRRQYLISRYYATPWWVFALVCVTFATAAFWGSLALAASRAIASLPHAWIPAAVAAALYAMSLVRGYLRISTARQYFLTPDPLLDRASRFDLWSMPLVSLVHAVALASAAVGRHLVWRGITYCLFPGGQVEMLRREFTDNAPQAESARRTASGSGASKPHIYGAARSVAAGANPSIADSRQSS